MQPGPSHCGDMSQETSAPKAGSTHRSRVTDPASRRGKNAFDTLSTSAVGLEMGVAVLIGLLFGRWLDSEAGTEPYLMILFTIFGFAAGIRGLIRGARRAERAEDGPA
jgi:F0F1-type ATP synthase assembly protein I